MRNDDLDQEKRLRQLKLKKDELTAGDLVAGGLGGLVMLDSAKNALLSKDHKVAEQMKKMMKDFPSSAFEHSVDSHDVIMSHVSPEFAQKHPDALAAAGVVADFTDPTSYLALKGAGKVMGKAAASKLPLASNLVRKVADKKADKAAEEVVKKFAKRKNMDETTPRLVDYIKRNNLRGKLDDPENIREAIDGKHAYTNVGTPEHIKMERVKLSDGSRDKVGQKIVETVKRGDAAGAQPINRAEIYNKLKGRIRSENASETKYKVQDLGPYESELRPALKPYRTIHGIEETPMPPTPDILPELPVKDMESGVKELEAKIAALKQKKADQSSLQVIESKAKRAEKSQLEKTVTQSKKEREAAEKLAQEEADRITAEMLEHEARMSELKEQLKLKKKGVKPLNLKEIPKTRKDGEPLSAKRKLDLEKFNEKAKLSQQKYKEYLKLPPVKTLEEEIDQLRLRTFGEPRSADDIAPPALEPTMFDELRSPAPEDMPPVIGGADESLESSLAELSDRTAALKNAKKENISISLENKRKQADFDRKAADAGPKLVGKQVPRISPLEDMWSVKTDAKKVLNETDWSKAGDDTLQWKKQQIIDVEREIDSRIEDSLKEINFVEGNAADIYRALKDDYGAQSEFVELLKDITLADWKNPDGKSAGFGSSLLGGVGIGVATYLSGGTVPLAMIAGGAGGALGRKLSKMLPQTKAKVWDRMSQEGAGHLGAQIPLEFMQRGAKMMNETQQPPTRELEAPSQDSKEAPLRYDQIEMTPEVRKQYEMMKKSPKSSGVETAPGDVKDATDIMAPSPIEQKMSETLSPTAPAFDPVLNEELLNTILPRSSERLLANPRALIAKLQQVAPDKVPLLKDMLDHDQEGLKEFAPMIAQMFPAMFERDKYGMFDGKIVDPMMKEKFLLDLSRDEGMTSIEKAELASKVKRGESIHT